MYFSRAPPAPIIYNLIPISGSFCQAGPAQKAIPTDSTGRQTTSSAFSGSSVIDRFHVRSSAFPAATTLGPDYVLDLS